MELEDSLNLVANFSQVLSALFHHIGELHVEETAVARDQCQIVKQFLQCLIRAWFSGQRFVVPLIVIILPVRADIF